MARRRRTVQITPDTFYFGALGLLTAASIIFAVNVQMRRHAWSGGQPSAALPSGSVVELVRVLDGDEVSVKATDEEASPFVVRLLGLKAFDGNLNDPALASAGQMALSRLGQKLRAADGIVLSFEERQIDRAGRLLAYLIADDHDVGRALIAEGAALAYTKYAHPRLDEYVQTQYKAKQERAGLWGNADVAARADALGARWAAEGTE